MYLNRNDDAIAHFSLTATYSNTWVAHQLASTKHNKESLSSLGILYLLIPLVPLYMEGRTAKAMAYFNRQKKWHQGWFEAFVNYLNDPAEATIIDLDRFDVQTQTPGNKESKTAILSIPKIKDISRIQDIVLSYFPPLVSETLDLNAEKLQSTCLHSGYDGTKYFRSRELLVLYHENELAGICLLETGSHELSLFGIFNTGYIIPITKFKSPEILYKLLAGVLQWFDSNGVSRPLLVSPPGLLGSKPHPAISLAETMGLMAWSSTGLRKFESFIRLRMGKLRRKYDKRTIP